MRHQRGASVIERMDEVMLDNSLANQSLNVTWQICRKILLDMSVLSMDEKLTCIQKTSVEI